MHVFRMCVDTVRIEKSETAKLSNVFFCVKVHCNKNMPLFKNTNKRNFIFYYVFHSTFNCLISVYCCCSWFSRVPYQPYKLGVVSMCIWSFSYRLRYNAPKYNIKCVCIQTEYIHIYAYVFVRFFFVCVVVIVAEWIAHAKPSLEKKDKNSEINSSELHLTNIRRECVWNGENWQHCSQHTKNITCYTPNE